MHFETCRGWNQHHQEETPRWMQEPHAPHHAGAHPPQRWQDNPQTPPGEAC